MRFGTPDAAGLVPQQATPSSEAAVAILTDRTAVPEQLLAPERGPVIDLEPLNPGGLAVVPMVAARAESRQPEPGGGGGEAEKTASGLGVAGSGAMIFLLPDLARTPFAEPAISPTPNGARPAAETASVGAPAATPRDDQAGVHRYILGVDEMPPPRIGPAGVSEAEPLSGPGKESAAPRPPVATPAVPPAPGRADSGRRCLRPGEYDRAPRPVAEVVSRPWPRVCGWALAAWGLMWNWHWARASRGGGRKAGQGETD